MTSHYDSQSVFSASQCNQPNFQSWQSFPYQWHELRQCKLNTNQYHNYPVALSWILAQCFSSSTGRWAGLDSNHNNYRRAGDQWILFVVVIYASGRVHKTTLWWLNDSRDSVYELCVITATSQDLQYKAEPLENNWALAPMDPWRRYGNASNCKY